MASSIIISHFISISMTLLKTIDTLILTKYAMVRQPLNHTCVVVLSFLAWCSIFLFQLQFYNKTEGQTLCLGFVSNNMQATSIVIVSLVNAIMLCMTVVCSISIIIYIKKSQRKFHKKLSVKQQTSMRRLTIRFIQTLSLYTADYIYHLFLQLDQLQHFNTRIDIQLWVVTTLFALKAILNPMVHTFMLSSTQVWLKTKLSRIILIRLIKR